LDALTNQSAVGSKEIVECEAKVRIVFNYIAESKNESS
jgi:hypothetical protein